MIGIDGIKALEKLEEEVAKYPSQIDQAARLAVNEGARFGRAESLREMFKQVNLPKKYLGDRLTVTQKASQARLEAVIEGRFDPTSLARFSNTPVRFGKQRGVRVKVSRQGGGTRIEKGFFVRLKSGNTPIDVSSGKFNVGLAIRLKPGETIRNKKVRTGKAPFAEFEDGSRIELLYGPSVNQIFSTVRDDVTPLIENRMEVEFLRQLRRLTRG